jgi:single-stranded-DNA-specific exonuclease
MEIRWSAKEIPNQELIARLSEEINVSKAIATILIQREIDTFDKAKQYFRPTLNELHDPFLMNGMEMACDTIKQTITQQKKMMVFGDYDVDGTTAVSLVYAFFRTLNQNIEYYIPDRYKEGYGISKMGIDYAHENDIRLIIALDCGIRSNDLIQYAKDLGIDFIICDHHLPGEELPNAKAILNPKRKDCSYPYKELSGAGIGFKLIQAYSQKEGFPEDKYLEYIDLVAVSIAADMVDMRGENRILAFHGLKRLNSQPTIGLQALMDGAPAKSYYTMQDIIFGIGPKINAAGRISDAKAAVRVLIETDLTKAKQLSRILSERNDERKELDTDITKIATEIMNNSAERLNKKSIVLMGSEWHKGVIGIVASRMVEQFYKPTIVFSLNDGMLTGSARSVKNFDIHEAISSCSMYVEQFGGHKYAAGLSVREDQFTAFSAAFEKVVAENITENSLTPEVEYDIEIELSEINNKMMGLILQMAPFGPGNTMPIFMSKDLSSFNTARVLKDKHLKLNVQQHQRSSLEAIGFGLAEHIHTVSNGQIFDACYCLEENHYNGQVKLQLRLRDIKGSNQNKSI